MPCTVPAGAIVVDGLRNSSLWKDQQPQELTASELLLSAAIAEQILLLRRAGPLTNDAAAEIALLEGSLAKELLGAEATKASQAALAQAGATATLKSIAANRYPSGPGGPNLHTVVAASDELQHEHAYVRTRTVPKK